MSVFDEVKEQISTSIGGEVFVSFNDLVDEFPGDRPDTSRPFDPVDLERVQAESKSAGLKAFSKQPNEGGVWFRLL